jgi:hypothetical protein
MWEGFCARGVNQLIFHSVIVVNNFVSYSDLRNVPAKLSRNAKQHPSNSAHFVRRLFVRGWEIYVYQFFIHNDLQAQFPTRITRGTWVVGTSTYSSIPNTTVTVMRPKWPNLTSPLTKANRPRLFIMHFLSKLAPCGFLLACFPNISPVYAA